MFTRERLTRWTDALRANPQKQYTGGNLATSDYTKVCCLGELCEVEGLEHVQVAPYHRCSDGAYHHRSNPALSTHAGFTQDGFGAIGVLHVDWQLTEDFGSDDGSFATLNMPDLTDDGKAWSSAASANDASVPWSVIADHFDKYYPCSDEVK